MAIVKFDRGLYKTGKKTAAPGYGQIEPNQVWFNRAGMVEAQCFLDPEQFSATKVAPNVVYAAGTPGDPGDPTAVPPVPPTPGTEATKIVAQNGAFLMVDKANKRLVIPSTQGSKNGYVMGINYSTERIYNQFTPQRRNFCLTTKDWMPRIGFTEPGMRINTNTVQWDTALTLSDAATGATLDLSSFTAQSQSFDVYNALKEYLSAEPTTPVYAVVFDGSDGELVLTTKAKAISDGIGNVYAQLVKVWDNADRTCSFQFIIINKPAS